MRNISTLRHQLQAVPLMAACALLSAQLTGAPACAADRVMNAAGTIHQVVVESRPKYPNGGGTRLVHRIQSAQEAAQAVTIPGTDEPVVDGEPAIALSPITGLPALVWTRVEGGNSEIYIALYDGAQWSTPRSLTANSFDDHQPQIYWGRSDFIHLMWSAPAGADGYPIFYEAIVDSKGAVVLSPSQVRLTASGSVSQAAATAPTLSASGVLFAFESGTKFQPRVSAYGGYDEPVPIVRRVDLILPAEASPLQSARVMPVGSEIVVFVRSETRLFYAIQSPSEWTLLRSLALDAVLTEERAELLVKNMIERSQTP